MSFLKQAYALEQEVLEDVVEPTGEELVEVDTETETTRQEAEAMGEELDRAVAVHKELENQNDTVREILEQDGEITPATAAVLEVARRTAAAGLGLDPDTDGKELVDAAGLESLVATKSVVALEEAEKASKSLWEKIKALWNAFVAKVGEFWNWLTKLLDFFSNKNKALANKLKAMGKEDFDKGLEKLNKELKEIGGKELSEKRDYGFKSSDFTAFDSEGKILDFNKDLLSAIKILDSVDSELDASIKDAKESLKTTQEHEGFLLLGRALNKHFTPKEINIGNAELGFKILNSHVTFDYRRRYIKIPLNLRFTKEELISAVLKADEACKVFRKYSEEAFKRYKKAQAEFETEMKSPNKENESVYKTLMTDILKSRKGIFQGQSSLARTSSKVMKSYIRIAQKIIASSGASKQEEK